MLRWSSASKRVLWGDAAPIHPSPESVFLAALNKDGFRTLIVEAELTLKECQKCGLVGRHIIKLFRDGDRQSQLRQIDLLRRRQISPVDVAKHWGGATFASAVGEHWNRVGVTWREAQQMRKYFMPEDWNLVGARNKPPCGLGFTDEQWEILMA